MDIRVWNYCLCTMAIYTNLFSYIHWPMGIEPSHRDCRKAIFKIR